MIVATTTTKLYCVALIKSQGYGKSKLVWANEQPSPKSYMDMDAVQRLDGNGAYNYQLVVML